MVVVQCENKNRGCARVFGSRYGMILHLRSCPRSSVARKVINRRPNYTRNSLNVGDGPFRLSCDEVAFGEGLDLVNVTVTPKHLEPFVGTTTMDIRAGVNGDLVKSLMITLGRMGRKSGRKDVESIINILRNPNFKLDSFMSSCARYRDCVDEETSSMKIMLGSLGFKKVVIKDTESDLSCIIYARSPISVLRKQIQGSSNKSTFFNPPAMSDTDPYCHPMMAEIGRFGVPAVSDEIMKATGTDAVWNDSSTGMEPSFVGMFQVYSDKSRTSLKESSFQFYPLHLTLLNFSEEYRRHCIVNGDTFTAFLSVDFYDDNDDTEYVSEKITRIQKLKLLHLSINYCINELKEAAYSGFLCQDLEGIGRKCHPCLASYCADIPESKDLTSVRNGNRSKRNCHRCITTTNSFGSYHIHEQRTCVNTSLVIQKARQLRLERKNDEADQMMDEYLLVDLRPCLLDFPFSNAHPILDPHNVFMFEPLHCFHLGISKELKRCLSERLKSEVLKTDAMPTKTGNQRTITFKAARMTILQSINSMLSDIQNRSPAKGLVIDFSNKSKSGNGNGLYNDRGNLLGMLEAKEYRSIDMVSPFIGMLTDRCCGETTTPVNTSIFVQYVNIVLVSLSYDGDPTWTEAKVKSLERMIQKFKTCVVQAFGEYQASAFCTEKFHLLDHICSDIRRSGGLRYGDAGLYEYTHTKVKEAYRSGSKRRKEAMAETLQSFMKEIAFHRREAINQNSDKNLKDESAEINSVLSEAMKTDCAVLVRKGRVFHLNELEEARIIFRKHRKAQERKDTTEISKYSSLLESVNKVVLDLINDVGECGSRVFCTLMKEKVDGQFQRSLSRYCKIIRVSSAFVPGIRCPTAKDYNRNGNRIRVRPTPYRHPQRIVSCRGFYKNPILRQDCILLESEEEKGSTTISLWVAKALAFVRLESKSNDNTADENERNVHANDSEQTEYVFIQYFDVVPLEDNIDKELGCVRLRWARYGTQNRNSIRGDEAPCQWYDLIPVSAIRGQVHVVRGDYGKNGSGVTVNINTTLWYEQQFYINRFFYDPDHSHYEYRE